MTLDLTIETAPQPGVTTSPYSTWARQDAAPTALQLPYDMCRANPRRGMKRAMFGSEPSPADSPLNRAMFGARELPRCAPATMPSGTVRCRWLRGQGGVVHPLPTAPLGSKGIGTMDKAWTTPRAPCHARTPGRVNPSTTQPAGGSASHGAAPRRRSRRSRTGSPSPTEGPSWLRLPQSSLRVPVTIHSGSAFGGERSTKSTST